MAFSNLKVWVIKRGKLDVCGGPLFTNPVTYVTGPAKTGHVGTNYTPSLYRSYLSPGIVFLHSVTYIMMSIKYLLRAENCNAIA